jgi:hypothetical protein
MGKVSLRLSVALLSLLLIAAAPSSRQPKSPPATFRLDSLNGLDVINVKAEAVTYRGKHAVRLLQSTADPRTGEPEKESIAILKDTDFKDGTIEAEIAGAPRQGAPPDARGFVGIAFRTQDRGGRFECFYVRFTNPRSDDQFRRNHSVQYVSSPEFPWERLRKETPGVYESYVDLEPGAWTKIRIVVTGTKARLYIGGADQPCLIVNDLKLGDAHGPIALWIAVDTDAYFSNLIIK